MGWRIITHDIHGKPLVNSCGEPMTAMIQTPIVVNAEIADPKFQTWSTVQLTRDYYPFRTGDQFAIYSRELRDQWHYECRRMDGTAWIPEDALTGELTPTPDGAVRFREWT